MIGITVTINDAQFRAALDALNRDIKGAMVRALDNTILAAREEAARRLAERFDVPQRLTGGYTRTERASRDDLAAKLELRPMTLPIRKLAPVQTATGVLYNVPGVVSGIRLSAFIAAMNRGGTGGGGAGVTGVFLRRDRPAHHRGPKPNRSYLRIRQQVAQVPAFLPDGLAAFAQSKLAAELERELSVAVRFATPAERKSA